MTYRLTHHSNGQEGDFLIPGTDSVNYVNGNFSVNSFEAAFSWSTIDSGASGKAFGNGKISYERQSNVEREEQLINLYYFNKVAVESQINYSEKVKVHISYSFMWGRPQFRLRNAFDIFVAIKPYQKLNNFSLFVRGYVGPDYYNLYFENTLRVINIGIIADPMKIPIIKKIKKKAG
jgi:hypothetical protein